MDARYLLPDGRTLVALSDRAFKLEGMDGLPIRYLPVEHVPTYESTLDAQYRKAMKS